MIILADKAGNTTKGDSIKVAFDPLASPLRESGENRRNQCTLVL